LEIISCGENGDKKTSHVLNVAGMKNFKKTCFVKSEEKSSV